MVSGAFGGDGRLEGALESLGPDLAFPPAPNLGDRVRAAIEAGEHRARPWMARRAIAFAAAALAVIATLTLSLSPAARRAVADWLGIGGVRIVHGPGPTPTAAPGANLALGSRATLDEARAEVDFPVTVPSLPELGEPDSVFVAGVPEGGRVSLVYEAGGILPNTDETGLGMIVTEFRATIETDFMKKVIGKEALPEITDVDGELAFWITGPHTVYLYRDVDGDIREDSVRLAGNALVWEHDGITYRIESDLDLEDARRVAESMS